MMLQMVANGCRWLQMVANKNLSATLESMISKGFESVVADVADKMRKKLREE